MDPMEEPAEPLPRQIPGSVYVRELFELFTDTLCEDDEDPRHAESSCPICCTGEWRHPLEPVDAELFVRTGWIMPLKTGELIRAKLDRGIPLEEIMDE